MAAKVICDNCGKQASMFSVRENWFRPNDWFERTNDKGIETACSKKCAEIIERKTLKTSFFLSV